MEEQAQNLLEQVAFFNDGEGSHQQALAEPSVKRNAPGASKTKKAQTTTRNKPVRTKQNSDSEWSAF